jgi:hypothetical protein
MENHIILSVFGSLAMLVAIVNAQLLLDSVADKISAKVYKFFLSAS